MNHKSAINWDYLAQAKRLQEKLQQYFGLVEQIRALEEDPELQAALGGLVGGAAPSQPRQSEAIPSAKHHSLPSTIKTASMLPVEKRRGRGDGERLLAFAREGEPFDGRLLLARAAAEGDPELAERVSAKQANDHLRRFANAGRVRMVTPGKRGHAGAMPTYELVTQGTSAAESSLSLERKAPESEGGHHALFDREEIS
jgi:hypothetical protein